MLAFNFFFIPPLYTFTIADPENVVALFFFLIVAVIVSNLTAATRRQIGDGASRAKTTAELYAFSRKLAGIGTLDDLLVGDGLPGLVDAEGPHGPAVAGQGRTKTRRRVRLSAGRPAG